MHRTIQFSSIFVALGVLISTAAVQDTFAQTKKVHDLDSDSVAVDFSPDGRYIATGDTDGRMGLWDVSTGKNIYYRSLGGKVQGVAFSPDGRYIAADGVDGELLAVRLNASSGEVVARRYINDEATAINSVAYSPDGKYVALGLDLQWAYLWDLSSNRIFGWGSVDASSVYTVAFSPDGRNLATGNDAGWATLWELNSWWTGDVNSQYMQPKPDGNVRAVAFSPKGKYLAADGFDGSNNYVTIYDVISGRRVRQIDSDINNIKAVAFSPDGQYLAVGGENPKIEIYRIGTEQITAVTAITREEDIQTSGEIHDLAWSPSGDLISDGRAIYRAHLPLSDDSPGIRLTLPENLISEVAFGPNATYFIFNAQFPILTGVADADVSYRTCTITLDLPGVPDNSLSTTSFKVAVEYLRQNIDFAVWLNPNSLAGLAKHLGLSDVDGPLDLLPDQPPYFMFPLQTIEERRGEVEQELLTRRLVQLVGLIPWVGQIVGVTVTEAERLIEINEIFQAALDPKISLGDDADRDIGIRWRNPGRPGDQQNYVILLTNKVSEIKIAVEQDYVLKSEPTTLQQTEPYEVTWDLENGTFAAPRLQPIALADYPPFQLLPPEVKDSLLRYFSAFGNDAAWRVPIETALLPNYPNPFNPETWIPYQLSEPTDVTVSIYSVTGTLVRRLALGHQAAGVYQSKNRAAYWDGRNRSGEPVSSGVYFYTLTAGNYSATRKMLVGK